MGGVAYVVSVALSGLRIVLFHPRSVELGGEPVRFPTRHAELAVHLLAMAAPHGMPAESLCEWLWPDAGPRRGPRLRTLLWQVRAALGDEAWRVQRRGRSLALEVGGAQVELLDEATLPETVAASLASIRAGRRSPRTGGASSFL